MTDTKKLEERLRRDRWKEPTSGDYRQTYDLTGVETERREAADALASMRAENERLKADKAEKARLYAERIARLEKRVGALTKQRDEAVGHLGRVANSSPKFSDLQAANDFLNNLTTGEQKDDG